MAVPKRKTTRMKRGMRRMHDKVQMKTMTECSNCGGQKEAHTVCPHCGHYRGRQVLKPRAVSVEEAGHQGDEVSA